MDDAAQIEILAAAVDLPVSPLRRHISASEPPPSAPGKPASTMNDSNPAPAEPDTCRICRGEGTADEPLFYPCKCSGSIKYVHQDCLMEWLSHSQKKHCELCKTPFRFTKLYSPNMPSTLPFHVFASHATKYLFRNALSWARAVLVLTVWLCWLPYLMRSVWSFLFWVSDEGFLSVPDGLLGRLDGTAGGGGQAELVSSTMGATVCPSSPLFAATTSAASISSVMSQLPQETASQVLGYGMKLLNFSKIERLPPNLLWMLFFASSGPDAAPTDQSAPFNSSAAGYGAAASPPPPPPHQHPTLLNEVGFLQNVTSSPAVNRTLIAILEGQIITVLVIVCFILIILVRDYVVQQQPEINMRAAFAAAENVAPAPEILQPPLHIIAADLRAEDIDALRGPGSSSEEESDGDDADYRMEPFGPEHHEPADYGRPVQGPQQQPTADLRAPHQDEPGEAWGALKTQHGHAHDDDAWNEAIDADTAAHLAASVGPTPSTATESSTVHEYLRIWREADGDRETILKIVREEGLEDKMDYWIKLTKAMMDRKRQNGGGAEGSSSEDAYPPESSMNPSRTSRVSDGSSEWTWPDSMDVPASEGSDHKGKGKAADVTRDPSELEEAGALFSPDRPRPRANTDGTQSRDLAPTLGSNNWTFSTLDRLPPAHPAGPSRAPESDPTAQPAAPIRGDLPAWAYPSAPSSTLAESGTPGSHTDTSVSSNAEVPASANSDRSDVAAERPETAEWENLPDFNDGQADRHAAEHADGPAEPAGLAGLVADFMFRNVDEIDPQELAPIDEGFDDHDGLFDDEIEREDGALDGMQRDQEVVDAAAAAGIDAEAIEDAEDFEGVLELIGLRGPIAGLFQNAIFCAFLVSITIFVGIFLPYNIGRIAIWTVANPMRLARILFGISKFVQDVALVMIGTTSWAVLSVVGLLGRMLQWTPASDAVAASISTSRNMSAHAAYRVVDSLVLDLSPISAGEIRNFSAVSHDALLSVKHCVAVGFDYVAQAVLLLSAGDYAAKATTTLSAIASAGSEVWQSLCAFPALLYHPEAWVIDLSVPEAAPPISLDLAYWGATDRVWAILGGYLALCLIAGLYLRRGRPFSSSQTGQDWEASIIDGLNQASGVMKVILIIGIEMLVFPLYCGLLLDVALLPLFVNTSVRSRALFSVNYPLTSIFVHWFVGTGYMFHFALFVSMCRKIMRKGVLYFIRDPDDPEFHPVRDVLERNVVTQLRKILFSAFVYGALVLICLGGVVWGLSYSLPDVLPIHYSSNEPVLEFPIDLLFYNFLMPLAVRFFRPSDGLHAMYTWWFRKCARALRITWFLFGERKVDEEGALLLAPSSPHRKRPWWRRLFLELNDENTVVPKTWGDIFEGGRAKPTVTIPGDEMIHLNVSKLLLVQTRQLIPDGRFVRTPASDQVKIPKGRGVFFDVTENNIRIDGKPDRPETDLYSSNQYQFVYIPPHFRLRVFLFILYIWMFAAVTGVGFTIVPLIFGRRVFQMLIPAHIRTNDIYAFSIGIYVLGSVAYSVFHIRSIYTRVRDGVKAALSTVAERHAFRRVAAMAAKAAKLVYSYFFLLVVFPLLVASLMELYLLIPLDTYLHSAFPSSSPAKDGVGAQDSRHTVRVIQTWTIGLLYLRLSARMATAWYRDTRLAGAIRAVLRRGWLEPDVAILTRAFVIPGLALWLAAVMGPLVTARLFLAYGTNGVQPNEATLILIYRVSYPATAISAAVSAVLWNMVGIFKGWRVRIRDEVYLIGERLHNFGVGTGPATATGTWRAGGARM